MEIYSTQLNLASQISWPAEMPLSLTAQQDAEKWRVNIFLCPCYSVKMNNSSWWVSFISCCQTVLFFCPFHLWGKRLLKAQQLAEIHTKKSYFFFRAAYYYSKGGEVKRRDLHSIEKAQTPRVLRPQLTCSIPHLVGLFEGVPHLLVSGGNKTLFFFRKLEL